MEETGVHIVILCSRLDLPGGIERAVVNTANLFQSMGHRTSLLVLDETGDSFYPLNEGVHRYQLPLSFGITSTGNPISRKIRLLSDVLKLRRMLKQLYPTILIATEYPFAAAMVLAGVRKKTKLVSWEHHHMNELEKNSFWDKVFRFTYPRLHQLVVLNPDEEKLYGSLNDNISIIPNYAQKVTQSSVERANLILTVSRLNYVKGIDTLIEVAKKLLPKHPEWKWKIIGHGRLDDSFMGDIIRAGLEERLIIQAPTGHDLSNEYRSASIYAMTSRNECFPMTLLEAMSHGLPCVAFDCETGPRHIITEGYNGNLVPVGDEDLMYQALERLVSDPSMRTRFGKNAASSVEEFSADKVYDLWKAKVLL